MTDPLRDAPLPCPFCGHVGLDFQEGSTFRWLEYSCGGCGTSNETRVQTLGEGAQQQWRERAERDAVVEWNTRAAPAADEIDRLTRELAAAKVDAERYRYLRNDADDTPVGVYMWHGQDGQDGRHVRSWLAREELDDAIDAALKP
jgi:predicted  nucleic acid-binding Zn-ribbon protein